MNDSPKQHMADSQVLKREDQGPVAVLTLNRPEARNCLSEALIAALTGAIKEIGASDATRAIVITGAGSAFSSGHDLKEMTAHRSDKDRGRAFFTTTLKACSEMMLAIVRSPKPVIAAVNGIATAAGCQLVASCDLAVASVDARFATPGVNIGLFCSTPMVALSRNVSRKAAMEMLLLGEMVGARGREIARAGQSRGRRRPRGQRGGRARSPDRREAESDAQDRQGGVLPTGRDDA